MKVLAVNDLKKVDTARYTDGDIFYTDKQIGMLHGGTIEPFVRLTDLKGYVKKTEVKKMIDEAVKGGK